MVYSIFVSRQNLPFSGEGRAVLPFLLMLAMSLVICPVLAEAPNFSATPLSGTAPLEVHFTADAQFADHFAWYFGDEDYHQNWTRMTDKAPIVPGNYWDWGVGTLADNSLISVGREDGVWQSNDLGKTWIQKNNKIQWPESDETYNGYNVVGMPDNAIVVAGPGGTNTVWESDDDGTHWSRYQAPWTARFCHAAVALPGYRSPRLVIAGGMTADVKEDNLNDVWGSANDGKTWTRLTEHAAWSPRHGQAMVALPDSTLVLMGGNNDSGFFNDVWMSKDKGRTWTLVTAHAGWEARQSPLAVAMPDGSIILMGGHQIWWDYRDVWRSTDKGKNWSQLPAAPWTSRYGSAGLGMADGSIVVAGGFGSKGYPSSEVWRLMPAGSTDRNPVHTYTTVPASKKFSVGFRIQDWYGLTDGVMKTDYITVNAS